MRRPHPTAIPMWLYPIASSTKFLVRGRVSKGTGAAGFGEMIDRDAGDDVWPISKNFKNVVVGDQIVVYATTTSTTPPRLIGSGTIQDEPHQVADEASLHIKIAWDVVVCRRLARDPIDASWLSAKLPVTKPTVTAIPAPLWPRLRDLLANGVPASSTGADIEQLLSAPKLSKTVRQQLVDARLGQGLFKTNVARIERGCRLTGITDRSHLRASHIKPWRVSTNRERLDGNNGLLLAPHVDHLFDRGLITFDHRGRVLISPHLASEVLVAWGLTSNGNVGRFSKPQQRYLEYHREKIFKAE